MSVRAPVGPINFATKRICIGRGLAAIRAMEGIDHNFLFYALLSKQDEVKGKQGAVFASINKKQIESITIPFPPLQEQKRIVAILDEAFEGIGRAVANAEKNLANARELFESYLNAIFTQKGEGWVERKLGEAVSSVSTGPFGSMLHKSDYIEGGIPIINPINIVDGLIIPSTTKTVSEETAKRLKTYALDMDDIVIARRGEIGRCAVIQAEQTAWLCGTGCFYIKPSNELNPYFLSNLLRSAKYREELEKAATGATMKNLSNTSLQNLEIAFPSSIEGQCELISRFDELSAETQRLQTIYQQKLTALAELKQSLLKKAFTGELTAKPETTLKHEAVA
jgi:type I restriction enzyme S subunit